MCDLPGIPVGRTADTAVVVVITAATGTPVRARDTGHTIGGTVEPHTVLYCTL